jgi:hypothetical protein
MGTGKKEKNRKIREGKVGDGMGNVKTKGENFYRHVEATEKMARRFLKHLLTGVIDLPKK